MVNAVVVPVPRIPVPVVGDDLDGRVGNETLQVENHPELPQALLRIPRCDRGAEQAKVGIVDFPLSGCPVKVLIHVLEKPAVVEVSCCGSKGGLQEGLVKTLPKDIHARGPPVQRHKCVGRARGWHAGAAMELAAEDFGHP